MLVAFLAKDKLSKICEIKKKPKYHQLVEYIC